MSLDAFASLRRSPKSEMSDQNLDTHKMSATDAITQEHGGYLTSMGQKLGLLKDKVTHVFTSTDSEHEPFEDIHNDLGHPMNHKGLIKKMMVREMEQVAHKASMFRRASCPEPHLVDIQGWRSLTSSHKKGHPHPPSNQSPTPPHPSQIAKQRKSVAVTTATAKS
ncbi:unnamed protein product, partial [Mesorhabditis belari]|uniref:Uncharacterized protein n=1 Tax=Mesorhabditis belari TaxID=2138241 RepID=A0AAF3F097_9BILA